MNNCISAYIHIPFCKKKCSYCDFFSKPCNDEKIPDSYIQAILCEAEFYAKKYSIDFWKTVYIGGGTPSLLTLEQIKKLLDGISKIAPFTKNCEITIEMNPDDITSELLECAKSSKINRLSIGIQSLSDVVLLEIERRCTRETTLKALQTIKNTWNDKFSVDVISGLPKSNKNDFLETLQTLISFSPDHFSLYALTLEENTPLGNKILNGKVKYDYEKADTLWLFGRNFLLENGYFHYEVSNFSKKGFESLHNKTYWNLENYLGLGAGASSSIYNVDESFSSLRWTNIENSKLYTEFWTKQKEVDNLSSVLNLEKIDKKTQEFEFLMMGFRLLDGISEKTYYKRFGKKLSEKLQDFKGGIFYEWKEKNLARSYNIRDETFFALTEKGLMFLNSFLEQYI